MQRLLLLMATRTYRARAFVRAAQKLGGEVVVGTERPQVLARRAPAENLTLDFRRPERAVERIAAFAREHPLDAIVGVDDDTSLVAAMASGALSLPGNSVESVHAAQNKFELRSLLARANLPSPSFTLVSTDDDPALLAAGAVYPCVLKPVFLAASRGVIRADDGPGFISAFRRIAAILQEPEVRARGGVWAERILVESFIPGVEVALEGLLSQGTLAVLALFDKPDPLDGPFFEETIYITPSRLPAPIQEQIAAAAQLGTRALGLREGPVHAELRVNESGVWIVEIAARSIGGLCSSVLEFGTGTSLEELILRHALGGDLSSVGAAGRRQRQPAGVMMLPIPCGGILRGVRGREAAEAVAGITGIEITIPVGQELVPLPEGDRYLGFIFARGPSPADVESALRDAYARLEFQVA